MSDKRFCQNCDWHGLVSEVLRAPNPFDIEETMPGCPKCKTPNRIAMACEHDGCWEGITCGTPLEDGRYALTCGKHAPWMKEKTGP